MLTTGTISSIPNRFETLSPQASAIEVRDIDQSRAALSASIDELEGAVSKLITRIQPLLNDNPRPTSNGKDQAPAHGNCELGRELYSQAAKLESLTAHVVDALDRLQV